MPDILPRFDTGNPYQFVLYVSTIVFIFALLFPLQHVENAVVIMKAALISGLGLAGWFIMLLVEYFEDYDDVQNKWFVWIHVIYFVLTVIIMLWSKT